MSKTILVVEDDKSLRQALYDILEAEGYRVVAASDGNEALRQLQEQSAIDLIVSDVHMPGGDGHQLLRRIKELRPELPVLLMTAYGTIQKAVEAMHLGAADYLSKPFPSQLLLEKVVRYLGSGDEDGEPILCAPASLALFSLARRVAASDATILITGESGTGKEVVARYLHRHSRRADAPFIAINCAAIPENMLEATLFGYEKGAFTGAIKSTPGKFELAQGGTLLLDEISEMDLALQAKLLRVLQEREVERLGSHTLLQLDVRVVATSNRDMRTEVAAGRFREDLYYRLNVFPLHVPPLRERRADIVPLAQRLLERSARALGEAIPRLDAKAQERLCAYPWPGNVRELENVMQRAAILAQDGQISVNELLFESSVPTLVDSSVPSQPTTALADGNLKSQEYELIRQALREGSRKAVAQRLGISERTLRYKLAKMREEGYLPDMAVGT